MSNSSVAEALFVRLYLDHHVQIQLATDLRQRGYDVVTTQEAGLEMSAAGRRPLPIVK